MGIKWLITFARSLPLASHKSLTNEIIYCYDGKNPSLRARSPAWIGRWPPIIRRRKPEIAGPNPAGPAITSSGKKPNENFL